MLPSASRRPASSQRRAFDAAEKLFRPVPATALDRAGGCPACGRRHPIAPVRSRHRSPAGIEHDWLCEACDHSWTTVSAIAAPSTVPDRNHRFAIGASVRMVVKYGARPPSPAVFEVLARRPSDDGETHYRIKSCSEAFERIVHERELSPAPGHQA